MSLPITILPTDEAEHENFRKNPKVWIEGKLEQIRCFSPLLQTVFNSVIRNNLDSSDFYLFLSFYAMDRILKLENRLESIGDPQIFKPSYKRIKLPERIN
jgi:hypothetical protein